MVRFKNTVFLCGVSVILSACGGGGGGTASIPTPAPVAPIPTPVASEPHQIASGADTIRYTGTGQRIGILDVGAAASTNDEYMGRFSYGIELRNTNSGTTVRTELTRVTASPDHADMSTSIAIGKTHGIAKQASVKAYSVQFDSTVRLNSQHINLINIFDDVASENLVAVNNSWGVTPTVDVFTGKSAYSDADIGRLSLASYLMGYDEDNSGAVENAELIGLVGMKCTTFARNIRHSDAGRVVATGSLDYDGGPQVLTNAELKDLYDLKCNGGYSRYADKRVYEDHMGADFIAKIEADKDNNRDAPIWVWATGNNGAKQPELLAGLPSQVPKAEDYWLAVTSVWYTEGQYRKTNYGAECGQAKRYCLASVSEGSYYIKSDGKREENGGTSGAAPSVTGGLAVITSAFPSKDRRWARKRILATASHTTADGKRLRDNDGNIITPDADGLSNTLGHGIMRLDLATQAVGETTLSVAGSRLGKATTYTVGDSFIQSGGAFGDGLKQGLSQIQSYTFDSMGAEFSYNLADNVSTLTDSQNVMRFFDMSPKHHVPKFYATGIRGVSFVDTKPQTFKNLEYQTYSLPFSHAQKNPVHMAFSVGDSMALHTRFSNAKESHGQHTITTALQYDSKNTHTIYTMGVHTERGRLLGTAFSGAYGGTGRAHTAFVQVQKRKIYTVNNWNIRYQAVLGMTRHDGFSGRTMHSMSGLMTSRFSIVGMHTLNDNTFGFALYQPLRLERGNAHVRYVSGVHKNTVLSYDTQRMALSPSGRQITLETYYTPRHSRFTFKMILHNDKGHIKGNTGSAIMLKYYKSF